MTAEQGRPARPLTKAELRARVVGNALDYDREDVEFWRTASDTLRGKTLYRLRARGKAITAAVPNLLEAKTSATRLLLTPNHYELIIIHE